MVILIKKECFVIINVNCIGNIRKIKWLIFKKNKLIIDTNISKKDIRVKFLGLKPEFLRNRLRLS